MLRRRSLYRTTWFALILFGWQCAQPLNTAAQVLASERVGPEVSRAAPARPDAAEGSYANALGELRSAIALLAPRGPVEEGKSLRAIGPQMRVEVEEPRALSEKDRRAALDRLMRATRALAGMQASAAQEFGRTERFIVDHQLDDELLARHRAAVAAFEMRSAEFARLSAGVERRIAGASGDLGPALQALVAFLDRYRDGPQPAPVDPTRLPSRPAQPVKRQPFTTPEQFRSQFGVGPIRVAQAGSLSGLGLSSAAPPPLPTADDLAATEDAEITPAVRAQAAQLDNNPVRIYQWVRNNIEYVPTFGSVQGSAVTLLARRGNAFDISSLLVALLRAANVPARYIYGTIELPIDQAMNWVGSAQTPAIATELLGSGGVPAVGLLSGGAIRAVRLEHVWVEAWVDFVPSRGAVNRQGDTWVPMDAAYKQYRVDAPVDVSAALPFDMAGFQGLIAQGLQGDSTTAGLTGLYPGFFDARLRAYAASGEQYFRAQRPDLTPEDLLGKRTIVAEQTNGLAGALPYRVVATGAHFAAVPAQLRHQATLALEGDTFDILFGGSPSFSYTISLPALSSRRLSVSYEPATAADAAGLASYRASGATSLPVYVFRLRPVVRVDGVEVAAGEPVTMGQAQTWTVTLSDPIGLNSGTERYERVAGDELVFGIDGNGMAMPVVQDRVLRVSTPSVSENLHQVAMHYWMECDLFDAYFARSFKVQNLRLPSVGVFATPLSVSYFLGFPRTGTYKSRIMDVSRSLRAYIGETQASALRFAAVTGMLGSYLEGAVFDQLYSRFQGTGQSAAQVLIDAARDQIPIYRLDQSNVAQRLPGIQLSAESKASIANAVAAGKRVTVPQRPPQSAAGYVIEDPQTGAGAYMLETISGGGQDDCGERPQPEPVRIPVIDWIKLALLVFLLLAGLVVVFGSGGAAAPAYATVVLALLIVPLAGATPAYAASPNPCCRPIPTGFHLGGDPLHDTCADIVFGPNQFPGSDVRVDRKNFDAISDGLRVLWEVKTWNVGNWSDFFRDVIVPAELAELATEQQIAHKCEYLFFIGVGDGAAVPLVAGFGDDVLVAPQCKQP